MKKGAAVCLALAIFLGGWLIPGDNAPASNAERERTAMTDSGIDYTESLEEIVNPGRGFYQALEHRFSADGAAPVWSVERLEGYAKRFGLLHLRFGLEAFSANGPLRVEERSENGVTVRRVTDRGRDAELSASMLSALESTLENLEKAGGTAIVRFSYNVRGERETARVENGKAVDRYVEAEPEGGMALIERHIDQLGEVLSRYPQVLASVETGMLGPWGEQHSTPLAGSGGKTYARLVQAWLNALPAGRTVGVRRPLYYIYWANDRYGLELTEATLGDRAAELAALGGDAVRVGVYNDGYLGSSTDLGTFAKENRESVVKFLNSQAEYTLYGGEVTADSGTGGIGAYNHVDHLEREAFLTHTSYLNKDWNYDKVIKVWEQTIYRGLDAHYAGKVSCYTYVANRLGYRLVLRRSELTGSVKRGGVLALSGEVENVGFANVVNRRRAQILLRGEASYAADVDLDARDFRSGEKGSYELLLRLPSEIPAGNYGVYLKLSDSEEKLTDTNLRTIRFANADERVWEGELGANYLGGFEVSAESEAGSYPAFGQIQDLPGPEVSPSPAESPKPSAPLPSASPQASTPPASPDTRPSLSPSPSPGLGCDSCAGLSALLAPVLAALWLTLRRR